MRISFVKGLRIFKKINSLFPVVPNLNTILASSLPKATYFTIVEFFSALFSVPLTQDSQYLWQTMISVERYAPGFNEAPSYFSQVFIQDLEDLNFLCDSVLI